MKVPIPPQPHRKLGQNFLRDENIAQKIVRFIEPSGADVMLEIGAGTGALTALLASQVSRFVAVEIDHSLLPYLQQIPNAEVIHQDIRKVEVCSIAPEIPLRIIGNLPYYISTSILTMLIEQRNCIADMVLMFQEEVAQRILASPSDPDYGMLSVLSQYFCKIEKGFRISRNCFVPRPDIESRVLRFHFRDETRVAFQQYSDFLASAFSERRKKLRNNLLRHRDISAVKLDAAFADLKIPENARAENLTPQQFEHLILSF